MISKKVLYNAFRKTAAVIAPNRCAFCGNIIGAEEYYCGVCYEFLPMIKGKIEKPQNIDEMIGCCYYRRRVRKAVLDLKYNNLIYPADAFGIMLAKKLENVSADVIVPVPSSFYSVKKRGFSTAEVIAKRVSAHLGIPVEKALAAFDDKKEQKGLNSRGRRENAKNCFYLKDGVSLFGKNVILIDDVCTTGSSLSAAAGLLKSAGARSVIGAVFAKTVSCADIMPAKKKYRVRG